MRVKVGEFWLEPSVGMPLMIELDAADRKWIAAQLPGAVRLARIHDDDVDFQLDMPRKEAWVEAEAWRRTQLEGRPVPEAPARVPWWKRFTWSPPKPKPSRARETRR